MRTLIRNGQVADFESMKLVKKDILIENGIITKTGNITSFAGNVIDAAGLVVSPGFIDLHVHTRVPGLEHKEDLSSFSKAAIAGGVTHAFAMPNTAPVPDNKNTYGMIERLTSDLKVKISIVGSITEGLKGEKLSDLADMYEVGARAFSDDGCPVSDESLMIKALEFSRKSGALIMAHSEDKSLFAKNNPGADEWLMVERDIGLLREHGGHLHICHVSTRKSVELIRNAKREGLSITAEASPHHFSLTKEEVKTHGTYAKVNPPLRSADDIKAVIEGLIDGTIESIATDHAPHHETEKALPFDSAPFGISGVETGFSVGNTYLVSKGKLSLIKLLYLMSKGPAEIAGIKYKGEIKEGMAADIVLLDTKEKFKLRKENMKSKGKNTPFIGKELTGKVKMTIANGEVV